MSELPEYARKIYIPLDNEDGDLVLRNEWHVSPDTRHDYWLAYHRVTDIWHRATEHPEDGRKVLVATDVDVFLCYAENYYDVLIEYRVCHDSKERSLSQIGATPHIWAYVTDLLSLGCDKKTKEKETDDRQQNE